MACESLASVDCDRGPYPLISGSRLSKCENNLWEIIACESFASVKFQLWSLLEG